jgi:N-methylhydantoinase B
MTRFDPGTLEVLWTRLRSVTDEAAKVIVRTSFSTLSIEANDFSCVLTDAAGNSLAQNTASIPSFIATLPATTRHMIATIGVANMRAGDIYITNNPWHGTGHLNDISLVKPVFRGATLVAFAATTSHVPDIGGRIRSAEPREIYEEGFHIPPMRLQAAGVPDQSLLLLLRTNVRTPDQTVGDIFAQASALGLMEQRVLEIMHDHGLADFNLLGSQLFSLAENAMRAAISALPEGTYSNEFLTDGLEAPFKFRVAVTLKGGEALADFSGTSPQQPRAINCVLAYTYAMTAYAFKAALLPELPNNEGMFRPIRVTAPDGCLLNPRMPASTGGRAATGHYVPPLIFGALAGVIPERLMAAAGSPLWILTVAGVKTDGKSFANVFFYNGGMGATARKDGEPALSWPSNISSTPSEIVERDTPFVTHYKRLRPGSGGAGKFRGGLGQELLLENRHPTPLPALFLTERLKFPAPGLLGGNAGALGEVLHNGQPLADSRRQLVLAPGDTLLIRTPGGGGYGDSAQRDPAATQRDRRLGYS